MPVRRVPARALKQSVPAVDGVPGNVTRPHRRAGRLGGVAVAAALVGSAVAAPLAATAATPAGAGGVNAPAPPTVVLKMSRPKSLANTLHHAKEPAFNDSLGMRAVRLAATRAGDPYVYGAAGPGAFDCSGLVMWVYDHLGKNLPRTAGDQYVATRHISHSQMKPGDLVFFANGSTVYHVAIYAGHGWIWAAPYPGKDVEKEKLWTSDFMAGRVR